MTEMNEKKQLILIVDDVPKNLQVLGNILREKQYKISVATNGRQALDMAAGLLPELILMDVMMPELDGFEACKLLKKSADTKDIPIIFLTAKTESEDIVKGFGLGAADYVTKPFNKAELLARVGIQLALARARENIVELEQKNAVLAMAVTASHEINQPLTVLQGNFEMLLNSMDAKSLTTKQLGFFEKMEKAIHKVQSLLRQFTDATNIRFENYVGNKKMVVFEQEDSQAALPGKK
ncbi:MAG: response regulator [bacterium]|nr:response regulator [bacterium]